MTRNRIDLVFARLKAERRSAFVTFTIACDPSFDESLERMQLLAENGIDLLEIGHPFSDPILDGATIQRANRRALAAGGSLPRTLDLCAAFRLDNDETPIILMGYANPIRTMGYDVFAARAAAAGVDGLIVADLPLREADALLKHLSKYGLVMIPLAAPSLPTEDFVSDQRGLGGFLYCIPVVGPTGGPSASIDVIADAVERCRSVSGMPIMVGFGIKTPDMAAAVAKVADGVIVATALIERFETMLQDCAHETFKSTAAQVVADYRHAIDS